MASALSLFRVLATASCLSLVDLPAVAAGAVGDLAESVEAVVAASQQLTVPKVIELLEIYQKLHREDVAKALLEEIRRRDAANPVLALPAMGAEAPAVGTSQKAQEPAAVPADAASPAGAQAVAGNEQDAVVDQAAAALQGEGDPAAALEIAETALRNSPAHEGAICLKYEALAKAGRNPEAIAFLQLQQANFAGKTFPWANDLADALEDSGRGAEAEQLYKQVAGDPNATADARKEASENLVRIEKEHRLKEVDRFVETEQPKLARPLVDGLAIDYPADPDVRLRQARVLLLEGSNAPAVEVLQDLKKLTLKAGTPFPGQIDLAQAYSRMERLSDANLAYHEILTTKGYDPADLAAARAAAQALQPSVAAALEPSVEFLKVQEGTAFRQAVLARTKLGNPWRAWAWSRHDDISLTDRQWLKSDQADRFEGGAALEFRPGNGFAAAAGVGGHEDGIMVLGSVNFQGTLGRAGIDAAFAERASDSLALELLNGRQNRVTLSLQNASGGWVDLMAAFYVRQLEIDGNKLGEGHGLRVEATHPLIKGNDKGSAEWRIGYAGEYHSFKATGGSIGLLEKYASGKLAGTEVNDLADPEVNVHGFVTSLEGHWGEDFDWSLSAGVSYDFEGAGTEISARAGVQWQLTPSLALSGAVSYNSSGRAANTNGDVWLASLSLIYHF
jgi:tetratricopeptide (TPR) repeat protein